MDITKQLVDYALNIRYEQIPKHVIEVQKYDLMDILGVMLGAVGLGEGCREIMRYIEATDKGGECTMIGTGRKASPESAALLNGALAHALDFEDSQDIAMQHPNSVPTPLVLTVADLVGGISGKELITAMVVGSDIACRLAWGLNEDLARYGWYMQPVHGSMGAVFAGARLFGLTAEQTLDAIAINLYMCSGSAEAVNSEHSLIRVIRDGLGAKSAMFSLQLAKSGIMTRFDKAFEGKMGYYQAYAGGNYSPERVVRDLGKEFQSEFVGFKPWPCCRLTHPAVGTLLEVMKENNLKADDIEHIHIKVNPVCKMVMEPENIKKAPKNAANAKFSMPFALGVAAVKGDVTLSDFEDSALCDSKILEFAQKVSCEYDETLDKSSILDNVITITADSKSYKRHVNVPYGSRENPMSDEMFVRKFKSCARYSDKNYTEQQLDELIDSILNVDKLSDARKFIAML